MEIIYAIFTNMGIISCNKTLTALNRNTPIGILTAELKSVFLRSRNVNTFKVY